MAVYRNIHISFWQDPFILDLPPDEKYFYLYLMTNSKTTQCGIYEIPLRVIEVETGYSADKVFYLINRFVDYKKILYSEETREVMILNWIKYNGSSSPKVLTRIRKELSSVKNKQYANRYRTISIEYGYSIDTEPQKEKEEEKEKEKEVPHSTTDDFSKVSKAYADIHQVLDLPYANGPLLSQLLDQGIPADHIIGVMKEKYKPSVRTLKFYEGAILDSWNNGNVTTLSQKQNAPKAYVPDPTIVRLLKEAE